MFTPVNDSDPNSLTCTYLGKVVDNNDPLKQWRLKITIPGILEGEPANLPWVPMRQMVRTVGGTSAKIGSFPSVPLVGMDVEVSFDQGSPEHPIWIGTPVQAGEIPDEFTANYPFRYGTKDNLGNLLVVDTSPDAAIQVTLKSASGVTFTLDKNGQLSVQATSGNLQFSNDLSITAGGHLTVQASGGIDLN